MPTLEKQINIVPQKPVDALNILQHKLSELYPQFGGQDVDWAQVLEPAKLIKLPADMLLMQPGSPCTQILMIIDGSVRVYQQNQDDREVTLYRSYCGDLCVLSINGMLHQKDFGAFAKTESKVLALTLQYDQFMKAMRELPYFCEFVLTNLTDRINEVLEMVERTVFEGLDTRLMCFLGRMSRESNTDTLGITHQELARELGTSREVISRILKAFERQGCIALKRGTIQITI